VKILRNLLSFSLPLLAAVVVPGALVGWRWQHFFPLGLPLLAVGLWFMVWSIALFIGKGRGTLAPWDPTQKLVVAGPYAHVRNPMISGVLFVILGEAVTLESWRIGGWAVAFLVINHVYFLLSEEPGMLARFGGEYEEYRRQVPRWIPRLRALRR
jgi:protein-S-isoprenylcysteine O-methyltransferase Ste14